MQIILTTARLRLREMQAGDLDFMAEMMGDAEVMRHFPKVATREDAAASIALNQQRYRDFGHGQWLAEELATGRPVGRCGLLVQHVGDSTEREIGYMFHRPFWKQGFAAEAALGVREYAFEKLGLPHVISLIRPENIASAGVAKRMGMLPWKETMHFQLLHRVWRVDRGEPCLLSPEQWAEVEQEFDAQSPTSNDNWIEFKQRWLGNNAPGPAPGV